MTALTALRRKLPARTCRETYKNYGDYKDDLREDFSKRCGYCDITDYVLGGKSVFQIDHFAPKKFSHLICKYSNLVYACPSCNRSKWDHWPMPTESPSNDGMVGFVDPCLAEYDNHLEREGNGSISARTELGAYMRKQLKLYLLRHRYLWMLDILGAQNLKIRKFLKAAPLNDPDVIKLKEVYGQLSDAYFLYMELVRSE